MRLRTVKETYRPGDVFTLYPLGDIHYGSANCDTKHLDKVINEIADDPLARWIGMGDYCEAISPKDKRWKGDGMIADVIVNQDRIGDYYVKTLSDILAPIADKCWAFGLGNHEETFNTHYFTDLCARILDRMGISDVYSGWAGITKVRFEEGTHRSALNVFHAHGYQAGRLDGAKVNALDYLMGYMEGCDIYLQGHSHSVLVKSKTKLRPSRTHDDLEASTCYGAHTGSFLRTYEVNEAGYSERAQYPPTRIGTVKFVVKPSQYGMKLNAVQ